MLHTVCGYYKLLQFSAYHQLNQQLKEVNKNKTEKYSLRHMWLKVLFSRHDLKQQVENPVKTMHALVCISYSK